MYSVLIFTSCNTYKETSVLPANEIKTDAIENSSLYNSTITTGCYFMNIEKDSAMANFLVNNKNVSGKLEYKRFQKDSNTGHFAGTMDSSKINGWYTFQSEGMISVRQVIFKIHGNTFSEGYGDIELKGDTAYFAYPHTLNYEVNHPFQKVICN